MSIIEQNWIYYKKEENLPDDFRRAFYRGIYVGLNLSSRKNDGGVLLSSNDNDLMKECLELIEKSPIF
jgi:hypothetical protein